MSLVLEHLARQTLCMDDETVARAVDLMASLRMTVSRNPIWETIKAASIRIGAPTPTGSFELAVAAASEAYGTIPEKILGRSRVVNVASGRQLAMSLYKELTGETCSEVGRRFGRDHGTVSYALSVVLTAASVSADDLRRTNMARVRVGLAPWSFGSPQVKGK